MDQFDDQVLAQIYSDYIDLATRDYNQVRVITKLMQLLLNDEALYQRLKKGTQAHYQHHFTANLMRDRHLEVYNASKRSA